MLSKIILHGIKQGYLRNFVSYGAGNGKTGA